MLPAPLVELAPRHKRSLTLANPIILASGETGVAGVGAAVTPPLTPRPRVGAPFRRVVEVPGGMLLRTGAANPGLGRFLHDHEREFSNSRVPVIAAFAAQAATDWGRMAARLEQVPGIAGVELHLNPTLRPSEAIRAVRSATELPILAKVELEDAIRVAAECIDAGANTLVIGRAPRGMMVVNEKKVFGRLYAPSVKPLVLRALADVVELNLDAPLVACGGVYALDDVEDFLCTGAIAVEVESAAWLDPGFISTLAARYG